MFQFDWLKILFINKRVYISFSAHNGIVPYRDNDNINKTICIQHEAYDKQHIILQGIDMFKPIQSIVVY